MAAAIPYITIRYYSSPWNWNDNKQRLEAMNYFYIHAKDYNTYTTSNLGTDGKGIEWEHEIYPPTQDLKLLTGKDKIKKPGGKQFPIIAAYWKIVNEYLKQIEILNDSYKQIMKEYHLEIMEPNALNWITNCKSSNDWRNTTNERSKNVLALFGETGKENLKAVFLNPGMNVKCINLYYSLPDGHETWFSYFSGDDILVQRNVGVGPNIEVNTHGKEKLYSIISSNYTMNLFGSIFMMHETYILSAGRPVRGDINDEPMDDNQENSKIDAHESIGDNQENSRIDAHESIDENQENSRIDAHESIGDNQENSRIDAHETEQNASVGFHTKTNDRNKPSVGFNTENDNESNLLPELENRKGSKRKRKSLSYQRKTTTGVNIDDFMSNQ